MPTRFLLNIIVFVLFTARFAMGQDSVAMRKPDSLVQQTSIAALKADSVLLQVRADSARVADSLAADKLLPPSARLDYRKAYWKSVSVHPAFSANRSAVSMPMVPHVEMDKDQIFYLLCGLFFILGILRLIFSKYFQDLFRLVFRNTSFRQKQLREQMLQTPLASLLMNLFFVLVGGVYISFMLQYYERVIPGRFWTLTGMCTAAVALLYLLKFIVLKVTGWVFAVSDTMDAYSFIVFLVNKLLGLFLLPFIVLIAFAVNGLQTFAVTGSLILVGLLFIYRYVLAYATAIREVKVSRFHFFLYLCAFEVAPLVLIYRALSGYI